MGQAEVIKILDAKPGVWMSARDIAKKIPQCGLQAVHHSLKSLVKMDDYEAQILNSAGRFGTTTVYRFKGEKNE